MENLKKKKKTFPDVFVDTCLMFFFRNLGSLEKLANTSKGSNGQIANISKSSQR